MDDPTAPLADRNHAQVLVARMLHRPEFQFFDNRVDPFQLTNRVDEPQYQAAVEEMKQGLNQWMARTGDKGVLTELAANKDVVPLADEVMPYQAWVNRHPFAFSTDARPDANPDGDDAVNVVEWLRESDPLTAGEDAGLRILETDSGRDAEGIWITMTVVRPSDWPGTGTRWDLERGALASGAGWTAVEAAPEPFSRLDQDPKTETTVFRLNNPEGVPAVYRLKVALPSDFDTAPAIPYAGETPGAVLGDLSGTLNNKDLTITARVTLPSAPPDANTAQVLWSMGAGNGMSLVLKGNELVFSGSASTQAAGSVVLRGTLAPGDFGRVLTTRVTLDHRVDSTDVELSWMAEGGTAGIDGPVIRKQTGYVGLFDAAIGRAQSKITGISGTPFGPLADLPNGVNDLRDWTPGPVRYEIMETVGAPLRP